MRDLLPTLDAWAAAGRRAALCTVVAVHGRAPLPLGASMIVAEDGAIAGAVSGGCVERQVAEVAQAVLRGAPPRRLRFAPTGDQLTDTALPCGGGIDVWVQPWGTGALAAEQEAFAAGARAGQAVRWRFQVGPAEDRVATEPTTGVASAGGPFSVAVPPRGRLVLVGAGPVAGALCDLAPSLGMRAVVVDPREAIAAHAPIAAADELLLCWPEDALARLAPLGDADAVIALSHQPSIDDVALRAAVASGAGFVGVLGSRQAHADRLERLRERGVGTAALARIVGPVGLDLGGWEPGEVALSIAAELVAARHGRAGGRLAAHDGPIHGSLAPAAGHAAAAGLAGAPHARRPAAGVREPDHHRVRAEELAMPVGAIVLAAGAGRRFGGAKQAAQWKGETLLARAVHAAAGGLPRGSEVVVVVGAHEATVRAALPTDVAYRVVTAADWSEGLGASLRAGLAAIEHAGCGTNGAPGAVMVLLADQPLVDATLVAQVAREGTGAVARGAAAARPVLGDQPGHPVVLGPIALTRAADLAGDRGLQPLLADLYVHEIVVQDAAPVIDIDHPADLLQAGPPSSPPSPRTQPAPGSALIRRQPATPPATPPRRWT